MRLLVLLAIAAGGCYSPNVGSCKVSCFGDQPCPGEQSCGADGYCHEAGEEETCANSFELTIEILGEGSVTGPGGLDCPGNCTVTLVEGMQPLVANPTNESRLATWTIDQGELQPTCSTETDCSLDFRRNTTLTVQFTPARTLTVAFSGAGTGTVKLSGTRDCTKSCIRKFDIGEVVDLSAVADVPAAFTWGGECIDRLPNEHCLLTFDTGHAVGAAFDAIVLTLLPIPDGKGNTIKIPAAAGDKMCPPDCTILLPPGPPPPLTTLTAMPGMTQVFDRWINVCDGQTSTNCTQAIGADVFGIALFDSFPSITVHLNGGGSVGIKGGTNAAVICGGGPIQVTTCIESFPPGTTVQLGANPDPTFMFDQWKFCPNSSQESQTTCSFTLAAGDHFSVAPSFSSPSPQ